MTLENLSKIEEIFQMQDADTITHAIKTSNLCEEYMEYLGNDTSLLKEAALVCDVGKIYIGQYILTKPTKLTALEKYAVSLHPFLGYKLLQEYGVDERISKLVLFHHGRTPPATEPLPECDDETAYYGIILDTIDRYTALTSDRPFRKGMSRDEAVNIICHSPRAYSPECIKYISEHTL